MQYTARPTERGDPDLIQTAPPGSTAPIRTLWRKPGVNRLQPWPLQLHLAGSFQICHCILLGLHAVCSVFLLHRAQRGTSLRRVKMYLKEVLQILWTHIKVNIM